MNKKNIEEEIEFAKTALEEEAKGRTGGIIFDNE